jgi:hypothetical protein
MIYRILADCIVVFHTAFVLFVVGGMAAILLGIVFKWRWVRNFWFRIIHFGAIAVVVVESVLGVDCPLTDWEDMLREQAGETVKQGTFIGRFLHEIIFVNIQHDILVIAYCLFGLCVLLALIFAPPRWPVRRRHEKGSV